MEIRALNIKYLSIFFTINFVIILIIITHFINNCHKPRDVTTNVGFVKWSVFFYVFASGSFITFQNTLRNLHFECTPLVRLENLRQTPVNNLEKRNY